MTTKEKAIERINAIFSIVSKTYLEQQKYEAQLKIFTRDNEVFVFPSNQFMESREKKSALSFAAQFLSIMLGNVEYITLETEAYAISAKVMKNASADEAKSMYEKVINEYGSLVNYPGSTEILTVMYDDGTQQLSQMAELVKDDKGKIVLDTTFIQEPIQVGLTKRGIYDNIFGGMLYHANFLKSQIESFLSAQSELLSDMTARTFYLSIAKSIAMQYESESPFIGAQLALEAYEIVKGSEPPIIGKKPTSH